MKTIARKWMTAGALVADRCRDAYSFDRYAPGEWAKAAALLLHMGLSEKAAEAVLRSKWTRWAADAAERDYGTAMGEDVADYVREHETTASIARLVAETF